MDNILIKLVDFLKNHSIDIKAKYGVCVFEDGNSIISPLEDLYISKIEIECGYITIETTKNIDNL